jgi:hypothetical protein
MTSVAEQLDETAKSKLLETWLKKKPFPAGGNGVHNHVWLAACQAVQLGLTDEEADAIIGAAMTRAPSPSCEVGDALRNAQRGELNPLRLSRRLLLYRLSEIEALERPAQ